MATCKDNLQVREKLVELLTGTCHFGQNCIGDCVGCLSDHLIANGVTIKGVEIDTVETVTDCHGLGEWISVTERLPKCGEVVLACGKRSATSGQFQGAMSKDPHWWEWKGCLKYVTHWMPLPTPPKGE